ncbi:hypothetical protein R3P38DRAFT_2813735 [Favolaschia claudopus]
MDGAPIPQLAHIVQSSKRLRTIVLSYVTFGDISDTEKANFVKLDSALQSMMLPSQHAVEFTLCAEDTTEENLSSVLSTMQASSVVRISSESDFESSVANIWWQKTIYLPEESF